MNLKTIILSVIFFYPSTTYSQDSIVFLHLRLKNDTITLIKSTIRPGVLKQPRMGNDPTGIVFEVMSQRDSLLFKNNLKDPSILHVEYEDPNDPTRLLSKKILKNDVEFTVRIPYKKEMHRVYFYRTSFIPSSSKTHQVNKSIIGEADLLLNGER